MPSIRKTIQAACFVLPVSVYYLFVCFLGKDWAMALLMRWWLVALVALIGIAKTQGKVSMEEDIFSTDHGPHEHDAPARATVIRTAPLALSLTLSLSLL